MSYYMANGVKVSQAAAGLGALPPQAAAGLGRMPPQAFAGLPPQAAAGIGVFGELTSAFQEGVLGSDMAEHIKYGTLEVPYRDGIFGMRSLGQVSGPTIDFGHEVILKETKLMLRYLNPDTMPVATVNSGGWGETSQAAFAAWAESRQDPSAMIQDVDGQVVPTAYGLYGLWLEAKGEAGEGYASTHWSHVTSWAAGEGGPGGTLIVPPPAALEVEEEPTEATGGTRRMSTLAMVGVGAAVAGAAWLLLRRAA